MDRVRAVVIGGGIVGVSVLYHLAKAGWRDVLLLERSELTAGSTWHAAAGFHAINGDPNVARLQAYTIDLYKEVEELGEQSCGLHMTGGLTVAASDARWEWLRAEWARQQVIGLKSRLVGPDEIKALCPIMDIVGVRGGIIDPHEGHLDPNGATYAFAKAAGKLGARVRTRTMVRELRQLADGSWLVITDDADIAAGHVVNAAGLWAPRVGEMAGLTLPIVPMEHMYLVTEPMEAVAALPAELPMTADLDANIYLRQEQRSILMGVYEPDPLHWHVAGVPWDFGMELIPDNLDRITEPLMKGFARFPALQTAGIRRMVNGGMVFSPDGNPIVGPVAGVANYWCACGSMAGFSQNGAIGKSLAEWMVHGAPSSDITALDVARFGPFTKGAYLLEKTRENYARRLQLTYPNEQLPAGRPYKTSPIYPVLAASGAVFGVSYGQEYPLYFATSEQDAVEMPTLRRSNAFAAVGAECKAVREAAGIFDASSFAKYRITGENARAWIGRVLAGRIPVPGHLGIAPMLDHRGRLIGDFTLFRLDDQAFMLFGSGYMQAIHMRWFGRQAMRGADIENVSDALAGFSLAGPEADGVLARAVGDAGCPLPLYGVARMEIGIIPAIVGRLSITGERGYEIYVEPQHQLAAYRTLLAAGSGCGLRPFGVYALNALRLEKAHGLWSREFSADTTPVQAGLERFIDYERGEFIGHEAARADHGRGPARRLVTLLVDATDADAAGFEPVWVGDRLVGATTSGGYGHCIGSSLALAYVDSDIAVEGASVEVHVVGERRAARIALNPCYDPAGARQRGMCGAAA